MARRPEKPNSRGRRSPAALDWLNEPDRPDRQAPEVGQANLLGGDGGWRPSAPPLTPPIPPAPSTPLAAGPQPTGPITVSRRAARARREAEPSDQAGQSSGRSGPANGFTHPQNGTSQNGTFQNGTPLLVGNPTTPLRERERGSRTKEPEPAHQPGPRRRRVATWLIIAAAMLGLWSATAFIDSGNFVITSLASISPLVSVFALPVIAIGVASRHLVPTAIAVAAALLPWTLVVGYAAAGPGSTAVGHDTTLRVMSVDGGQGAASAKDIVQVARIYSADIVVVTGLTSDLTHQLTVDGLSALAPAAWVKVPDSGTHGTGVWSGPKIDDLQKITELSRDGVDGAIESGTDRIGITVVQLDGDPLHPGRSWHSDLTRLANRQPATEQGFIVGDLNATPWQPAFRRLTASGWRDAADALGQGLRPTWPSWSAVPIAPLDHVLVRGGIRVSSADTTDIAGSGHRALIVTLVLPNSGGD